RHPQKDEGNTTRAVRQYTAAGGAPASALGGSRRGGWPSPLKRPDHQHPPAGRRLDLFQSEETAPLVEAGRPQVGHEVDADLAALAPHGQHMVHEPATDPLAPAVRLHEHAVELGVAV